ncbi:MAG TPA: phosphoglycerate kinase [Stellaceae bacterium]|jgi:phosphoglycerate kinase|nr:phosphoglycerate kinase [Stellaceae bacterium]
MPRFHTLDDLDVAGKRVLLRADLNVPVKDGEVTDATRIERLAPTIEALIAKGAKTIVMSHFGRPKGVDPSQSLRPLAAPLSRAIGGKAVRFASDCIGPEAKKVVDALKRGDVALLENLRFHPEEEKNDPGFAKSLAALGDVYIDDAFSAAHRAHASIAALAHLLPNAAGKLMQAELEALGAALEHPEHPVMALIGGSKVSTKLDLLKFIIGKVDRLAIGGAMANTFLYAQGRPVGRSLCEKEMADTARDILAAAEKCGCTVILPDDAVTADKLEAGVMTRTVGINAVPTNAMILDIGPDSVARISAALAECKTLVWNGPVGAFETKPFDRATVALAKKVAELTQAGKLLSVAGGGDTVAALAAAGVEDRLTYVSTAGGAFLEWLEGRELPGVAALAVG